jgi:hypothetical protein
MTTEVISADLREIFDDPDFARTLRVLARELGDVPLSAVKKAFEDQQPVPERTILGQAYYSGGKGKYMAPEGTYPAKLASVTANAKLIKLMFAMVPANVPVYLYYNVDKDSANIDYVLDLTKQVGHDFTVVVKHNVIKNTGDKYAIISEVDGIAPPA